jgi:hypothetical protein
MSFAGVDATGTSGSGAIGATRSANAASGAPTASLTTTRANSWVFGVGNDYDNAVGRTLGANQTSVHQFLSSAGDTYWVQSHNAPTPVSGTNVTINDIAPTTDRYNLSIVEILPSSGTGATFSLSGTITPAAAGSGATLTLLYPPGTARRDTRQFHHPGPTEVLRFPASWLQFHAHEHECHR